MNESGAIAACESAHDRPFRFAAWIEINPTGLKAE